MQAKAEKARQEAATSARSKEEEAEERMEKLRAKKREEEQVRPNCQLNSISNALVDSRWKALQACNSTTVFLTIMQGAWWGWRSCSPEMPADHVSLPMGT